MTEHQNPQPHRGRHLALANSMPVHFTRLIPTLPRRLQPLFITIATLATLVGLTWFVARPLAIALAALLVVACAVAVVLVSLFAWNGDRDPPPDP